MTIDAPPSHKSSLRTLIGPVPASRWLGWLVMLAAAVVGGVYGYGFGLRVGGSTLLGVVAAANGALFCSLIADAVFSRLMRLRGDGRNGPNGPNGRASRSGPRARP